MMIQGIGIGKRGYALLSVVVISAVLLTAGAAALQLARTEVHSTADQAAKQRAFYIAETGVQRGLAQLEHDRTATPSSVSTTYSYTLSNQSFGSGTYNLSIAQDTSPWASDPTRKLVTSTATFANQTATVTAHAMVQNPPTSGTICAANSSSGTCRISIGADLVGGVFNGTVASNNNVELDNTLAVAVHGTGDVYAHNQFVSGGALTFATTINGTLHSGVAYSPSALCLAGACSPPAWQFTAKLVDSPSIASFPHLDYEAIKRDSRTVIVRNGSVPAGTSWSGSTWNAGTFATTADSDKIYYVEGNASLSGIQLFKGAHITIVARGTITLSSLTLMSTGLINGSSQTVRLLGESDVNVGSLVLPLSIASVATTTNNFFTYSETGSVTLYTAAISALVTTKLNMTAANSATWFETASVGNTVTSFN